MTGIYLYSFVSVTALVASFVAQWIFPPRRRSRIIFAAATVPSTLLIVIALAGALWVGADEGWFRAAVTLVFSFLTFLFVGLVAAIMGSELASLTRRLLRRRC